jgi:hypothetical protein
VLPSRKSSAGRTRSMRRDPGWPYTCHVIMGAMCSRDWLAR